MITPEKMAEIADILQSLEAVHGPAVATMAGFVLRAVNDAKLAVALTYPLVDRCDLPEEEKKKAKDMAVAVMRNQVTTCAMMMFVHFKLLNVKEEDIHGIEKLLTSLSNRIIEGALSA